MLRCLLHYDSSKEQYVSTELLRGVFNSGLQLINHVWHIAVPSQYSLLIDFLQFHLPSSPQCKSVGSVRLKHATDQQTYTYCGHRIPRNISFPQSHVGLIVQCIDDDNTPKGFHFVMTFQAFDIDLTSVTLTQWNEHEIFSRSFAFAYLSIAKDFSFGETAIQLHIVIMVYNRIKVQYSPNVLLNLKIYDGPGLLSPVINTTNKSHVTLSSYQGFVTDTNRNHDNITAAYVFANNQSCINSSFLNWTSAFSYKGFGLPGTIQYSDGINPNGILHLHGPSGKGFLANYHGTITIHQMIYTGVNMLRHSPSTRSPSCQYGGLFVFMMNPFSNMLHHSRNYITICSNVSSKAIMPVNSSEHSSLLKYHFIAMFITFKCYSSGFVDLTVREDTECLGSNVAISRGPSCNNYFNYWSDKSNNYLDLGLRHCSDFWLLNEIDLFESSPFENCTFTLDHAMVGFPIGTYKMIISSSVIHQLSFSAGSIAKSLINLDMQTFGDLNTANQSVVSVTLADQNEYTLNISSYTKFTLNWLRYDQFPVFAVRVQFIENRICSPTVFFSNNRLTFGENVIYEIENDSNVYLLSRHPYDEISTFLDFKGYNRGTCRALVAGQTCSHSMSQYHIIRIHYRPHKYLALPQEIDISMKKTGNCAYTCSLDIGILEYKDINSTRQTRYHEWKNIYRVTWQVIAADSRGFSVTINTTCTTCTTLCDVAVALGLPLTSNKKKFYANVTYARYVPHVMANIENFTTANVDVKYLDHIVWLWLNLYSIADEALCHLMNFNQYCKC